MAEKRLHNLICRLERDNLYERYDKEINKLIESEYAEVVPPAEINTAERIWYLPHHCVHNPNKPDKLRVVFDCAARFCGRSLNERCLQGPDLVNKLLHVLLRFRLHAYAIQSDIRAMYSQVAIPPRDRDALRFLWWKDGKLLHMRMSTHLFGGVWCASSSAYALRKTVHDNPNVDPLVREVILKSMYVDDLAHSVCSKHDARKIIVGAPAVLQTGGFELTQFVVNEKELMSEIPTLHRAKEVHEFTSNSVGRTLGLKWLIQDDTFVFSIKDPPSGQITRRVMLSFVASIFDPLGLISPWVLPGKLLLQEATRQKLDWDQLVPEEIQAKWSRWIKNLEGLSDVNFARCVKPLAFNESYCELHIFSDASLVAYGACAYLRCINTKGEITCQLLISKAHISPINKRQTIPRLELQAATCAAKLYNILNTEFELDLVPSYFWSDSKVVLGYITNESRRFRTFVTNRVSTIRAFTDATRWRHVSSLDNPTDSLMWISTISNSLAFKFWSKGPTWLTEHTCFWRKQQQAQHDVSDDDAEVISTTSHATVTTDSWIQKICAYYSSFIKVIRCIGWLRRFAFFKGNRQCTQGPLTASEFNNAHDVLIRHVQENCFEKEIEHLKVGKPLLKSSCVLRLNPYLDQQQILRVGGRTSHHPILISHKHPIASSIVRYFHSRGHTGCEWTLSIVREKYWITKARRILKKVISKCVLCRKMFAKPSSQIMADLPAERIEPGLPPFTYVGIDAFGPYQTKFYRGFKKRYGLLFTCMTCRAIHIEMLYTLDCESFLCAFKRFIARRGVPTKIFSDNGRNFVKGEQELRKAFLYNSKHVLMHYTTPMSIEWCFIPPRAPNFGGAWERAVSTLKRVFRAILPKITHLTDETLATIFCEVENIVNGRPLTKLSDDINDLTPLTPNALLNMKFLVDVSDTNSPADAYRKRYSVTQKVANQFWSRWVKEYLPTLNTRSKWITEKKRLADWRNVSYPGVKSSTRIMAHWIDKGRL